MWEHTQREGVAEPAEFPVAPDLVEALAEIGRLDEVEAVTRRLNELSQEQDHPWGLASTKRCCALLVFARTGSVDEARELLTEAAEEYGALDLRFDRARSLLALSRIQRRPKKWAAARSTLEQAAAAFDELAAAGWSATARDEIARVGGRRPGRPNALTPAEEQVARLAAGGLSNKEIARRLFVTSNTVETHLKHVYAKLAIRSRRQLAAGLSGPVSPE